MKESVIIIDARDNMVGTMDKITAHLTGTLHRAFSVFIFNEGGELLLQQRNQGKYHSGGLWTNTCCSHPWLGENTKDAAIRRLKEEMGISCELNYEFNFTYKANVTDDLTEHELDHVFFGISNELPVPNPEEVSAYKYININILASELEVCPEEYTQWLRICFHRIIENHNKLFNYESLAH